jgi:hypothetical protein
MKTKYKNNDLILPSFKRDKLGSVILKTQGVSNHSFEQTSVF